MLPKGKGNVLTKGIPKKTIPTKTYRVKKEKGVVSGNIDGLDAMEQAIYKIIFTERYRYVIYNWEYGIELADLFGRAKSYVIPEIKKRIEEALLADERIKGVTDFQFSGEKGSLEVAFVVHTTFGTLECKRQVEL